jgi:MinD-like ATPase involved in chromosome partitioning or flagellar assembly
VATADHDKPAGAAEGARDDRPAGPAAHGAGDEGGGPDAAGAGAADVRAGDNDASEAAGAGAAGGGSGAGPAGAPDDYEPYLPPGPNPFSSVHPQGAPPYRPLEGGDDSGGNGLDEQRLVNGGGLGPDPVRPIPWGSGAAGAGGAGGPSWTGIPVPPSAPGSSGLSGPSGSSGGARFERPEAGPADPFGRPRHTPDPGRAAPPEPGYHSASPYPPLPGDEPGRGRSGPGGYGGASPYPSYQPYGPDDQAGDDALTDYGLPSPQSYGYAPPPPPVEPLPGLGIPEPGFPNETPQDDFRRGAEDLGYRGDAVPDSQPGEAPNGERQRTGGAGEDESALPPAVPGAGRPAPGGHRRSPGLAGQHSGSDDFGGPGLPGGGGPGGGLGTGGSGGPGGPQPGGGPLARGPRGGAPRGGGQPGLAQAAADRPGASPDAAPGLRGDELAPLPAAGNGDEKETAASLTSEALLHGKRAAPASGWRRTVFKASGGLIRVGESAAEQRRRELVWRVRTPVAGGHHRVAVMSLKGGVGKTTTTVGLGATLASLRGDRVIAVDANPDRGTLSDKVRLETSATVRDLLNERGQVHRYADVRAFTSQAPSRLEVLASDRDPAVSVAFSEEDYFDVARVLEHYYSICLTDCGTGLLHSAMAGVLRLADQIVLVSSPSVDGARSASATLDWLDAHDYGDLVRNAVVVLSTVRPRSKSTVDLDRLEQHFAARCRAVTRIPYDPHLEEGAEVELEQLSPATTEAYLRLAATVGDGFAWPRRAIHRPASAHP